MLSWVLQSWLDAFFRCIPFFSDAPLAKATIDCVTPTLGKRAPLKVACLAGAELPPSFNPTAPPVAVTDLLSVPLLDIDKYIKTICFGPWKYFLLKKWYINMELSVTELEWPQTA